MHAFEQKIYTYVTALFMKVIARKVDTRLMVEIFIDWTFRILLNSFSTDSETDKTIY